MRFFILATYSQCLAVKLCNTCFRSYFISSNLVSFSHWFAMPLSASHWHIRLNCSLPSCVFNYLKTKPFLILCKLCLILISLHNLYCDRNQSCSYLGELYGFKPPNQGLTVIKSLNCRKIRPNLMQPRNLKPPPQLLFRLQPSPQCLYSLFICLMESCEISTAANWL